MPEQVIETDAAQPQVADKAQGKDDTVTISKAELESLNRRLDESEKSERAWANFHRSGSGRTDAAAGEPEEKDDASEFIDAEAKDAGLEGDTPEKLVDELAAQGVSAISKRGFITSKDAQRIAAEVALKVSRELIGRERQKITSDTQLMTEFPELRDQNSELFKATAIRYQKAVAMDPNAKKTPAALYLAADAARESLKSKAPPPRRRDDDEGDYRREPEDDRRARADSQDSRPRGRSAVDDIDDMLGDEARAVIKGMGITEAEFQASKKETLGSRPRSRR